MILSETQPEETRTARIIIRADSIIHVEIKPELRQTLKDAEENIRAAVRAAKNTKPPIIVDIRQSQLLDPQVRQYYAKLPLADAFKALALLVEIGPWGAAMGNIYLAVARHTIPTKLFSQLDGAVKWLKTK